MKKILFVLLLCLGLAVACSKGEKSGQAVATPATPTAGQQVAFSPMSSLTPDQALRLIGITPNLLIVDVRSPQELREGKIANSMLVPFWNIMKGNHSLPKDRPLLLVCAVGGRSYAAMQILSRQGYTRLYNLKGGMNAWKKAGKPVVY